MGQVTLPATSARHNINARTGAERDNREVRFFFGFWAVYARAILGSWNMYSLNE